MTRIPLQRAAEIAVAASVVVVGFTLCRRGIILADEGYLLMQALDMARGKVLYRDMDSFVAPGVWFLLAGLFRVVEPSVIATRVPVFLCFLAMVWTSARVADRVSGRWAALATATGLGVAAVWAFPAWTFSFYSPYSILFSLMALERLVAWLDDERPRDLVWTGVFLGLAGLFKQNYGAFAAVACAVTVCVSLLASGARPSRAFGRVAAAGLRMAGGMALPLVPAVVYFVRHGALGDAFEALVVHPFQGFVSAHTIPYLGLDELVRPRLTLGVGRFTYGAYAMVKTGLHLRWGDTAVRFVEQLHVVLYWLPLLLFAVAGVLVVRSLSRRTPDRGLLAVLAVGAFVFLGVFPRADFNHLVNVYQPIVLLGAVLGQRLLTLLPAPTWRAVGAASMALTALPFAVVGAIWLRSLTVLLNVPLEAPRAGVLEHLWEAGMIDFEVESIRERTAPGEAVLTVPGLAMLNFLAEREMPSRYYNLYAVHIAHDRGAGVVAGTERHEARFAVTEYNNFFSDDLGLLEYAPVLADHLRRDFAPVASVGVDRHLFLERRGTPLPKRSLVNPLADCDVPAGRFAERVRREHLFFESLYHYFDDETVRDETGARVLETACTVAVPDGARLRVRTGYRQPRSFGDDAELIAEITLGDDGREPLLQTRLRFEEVDGWASPPAEEHLVDLDDLGGREVTMVFRTILEGHVEMNPLHLWGFAMVWHDPQIETAPKSSAGVDRRAEVRKLANP